MENSPPNEAEPSRKRIEKEMEMEMEMGNEKMITII